jgi:putative transposase
MARKLRVEFPGALYHVMSRGDHREAVFRDDADRWAFLETLAQACQRTDWRVHAWCLMDNHFHLVMETPRANLVAGMKWLLGVYTGRFNRRHKLFGHLFSGRYKALMIDDGGGYLKTACDYVHLNPVRAGLLAGEAPLASYAWSSFSQYLCRPVKRPFWLRVNKLFGEHGIPKDSVAGRRQFERQMEQRRVMEDQGQWDSVRRGWYLGDETFRQELLAQMKEKRGQNHYGEEASNSDVEQAEGLVKKHLKRLHWREEELGLRRKGDRKKTILARRLRQETTMTLNWIAQRLKMGTAGSLANRLRALNTERK